MKLFIIGDEYTVLGYSLIGINGVVVKDAEDATIAFNEALKDPDIGILLITQRVALWIKPIVDSARLEMSTPIVLEIPDREGTIEGRESAMNMIRRLIGIKI